jgi:hypothetical protein
VKGFRRYSADAWHDENSFTGEGRGLTSPSRVGVFPLCVAGWREFASLPVRVSQDVGYCAPGACKGRERMPGPDKEKFISPLWDPGFWEMGIRDFVSNFVGKQEPDLIFSLNAGFWANLAEVLNVRALGAAAVGAVAGRRGRVLYKTTTAPKPNVRMVSDEAVLAALNGTGVEVFDAFGMTFPLRVLEEENSGAFYWDNAHFRNQVRAEARLDIAHPSLNP